MVATLRISSSDMVALKVRAGGRPGAQVPPRLYQMLPPQGLGLLATLPAGAAAVSIPAGRGYPILEAPESASDGGMIVYVRKPNRRYEAESVRFEGRMFDLGGFVDFARRRLEETEGAPVPVSGRYVRFQPSRGEWDGILRDGGYAALDGTEAAVRRAGMESDPGGASGIELRVPVWRGSRPGARETLPVFSRVEVREAADGAADGAWVGFDAWRCARASRARLPETLVPRFVRWIGALAAEAGVRSWHFRRGMLFGDRVEWWGEGSRRRTAHEGIDFVEGDTGSGLRPIPEGLPVRSPAEGEAVAFLDDFLGKTVLVRHAETVREDRDVFHTLLSHLQAGEGRPGRVGEGDVIGRVGRSKGTGAPAHLHLAGAWIPRTLDPGRITIEDIHPGFAPIVLVDLDPLVRRHPLCRVQEEPEAD
ncbi:MAG: M23 family metallopeptidase [Acidobacteria bacterium]|nr:M23 family metallopeptidase [Acidobacteriota bacterium]